MKKKWFLYGVLALIAIVAFLGVYRSQAISIKETAVIGEEEEKMTLKLENIKSIDIHDVISSKINSSAHIDDPAVVKQLEDLFNKTSFTECTDSILNPFLFVTFNNDSDSMSFFIHTNGVVNMNGVNYKSKDVTFEMINRLYLQNRRGIQ